MPKAPETQALIDEMESPSLHTGAELKEFGKGAATVVRLAGQQLALVRGLLQEAEESETDSAIRGHLETITQQLDAQNRILGHIAKETRSLRISRELLAGSLRDLHVIAGEAGYEVP